MKTQKNRQSEIQSQKPIIQGHILKFIHKKKPLNQKGIICFPEQTYGISQQSPEIFKLKNTLQPQNSYIYRHQNRPQFKYFSQKRYFSLDGSLDPQQSKQIHLQDPQNKVKFHRKKGRLSEFLDKNGWMNKTTKLMGFERDDRARQISNRERQKRILSLKPKNKYQNPTAIKPDTAGEYFRTLATFTSEKMRIRNKRNKVAQKFSRHVQTRQGYSSPFRNDSPLDRQYIQSRMLKTTRDWSPSKLSNENFEQSQKVMNSTRMLKFYNTIRKSQIRNEEQQENEKLQKWYRTTCTSKWVYDTKKQTQQDLTPQ